MVLGSGFGGGHLVLAGLSSETGKKNEKDGAGEESLGGT